MITEQGNRIYYLKSNGNIIYTTGEAKGWITPMTQDDDWNTFEELKKYNREEVGVIELKYGELDELLEENKANEYRVDVSGDSPKLVFSYIDYNTGEPTPPPPTLEEVIDKKVEEKIGEKLKEQEDKIKILSETVEGLMLDS